MVLANATWAANPELEAQVRGVDDESPRKQSLLISSLEIDLDVFGAIAAGTLTATFANPSDDELKGILSLQLPQGAVVNGYALDINGQMVDGVLVEPLKAKREYQEKVRVRVDPGVASVSRGAVFSTSIYPIPAAGARTVRLRFVAPIHPQDGFSLPLATQKPVGNLRIQVRAGGLTALPALRLPNKLPVSWQPGKEGSVSRAELKSQALNGELHLGGVNPAAAALLSTHPNGKRFFQILDSAQRSRPTVAQGQRLRVYWDRSLSRRDDRLAGERALLAKYLAQAKPASIDVVLFNSTGARVRRLASGELDAVLGGALYRGATSFAVLERLNAPPADICLVFTDGVATIDPRRDFAPGCEVFAITSAADADRGFLERLVRGGGGAVLNLLRQSDEEVLARLRGGAPRVVDVRAADGRALRFARLEAGVSGWAAVGEAPRSEEIIVRIAGVANEIIERRYQLKSASAMRFCAAGALWAADRVGLLAAEDGAHASLVALSRQYSVASPALSFIVLETPEDYVQAKLEPPSSYQSEQMKAYLEEKANYDEERSEEVSERLSEMIEAWEDQKEWWATDFEEVARQQKIAKAAALELERARASPAAPPPTPPATLARAGNAQMIVESSAAVDVESFENVVVTGMRAPDPAIGVSLEAWSPDRPYLKALDAATAQNLDRVLAREEQKNSALPAFYFDVAEWLYRKKRPVEAIEMLLSALELPVANEETLSMVADRLLRYGRFDRAIWMYERALEQSNELPQPRRTLALALAKRAAKGGSTARLDLVRAMALLNEIIITPWEGDYDGIEIISLMDANSMVPALLEQGVDEIPLDPRLRALLDVDIRVVIEWNTAASDMDLWVDEPSQERAIYSHPRTVIGGRLSNDMTSGFGPEEYLLRRAPDGEYRISVNVYAADAINPNGTTVVTAHLFRNFARPNQQEETIELELRPDDTGEKLIGKFAVRK